ncbi:MAG: hypothetical protein WCK28_00095 [Burkholderiales bacterium]|jgi:hypothetical protein
MSALSRHWAKYPPVHVSVALYLGGGETKAAEPKPPTEAEVAELMSSFPMVTR